MKRKKYIILLISLTTSIFGQGLSVYTELYTQPDPKVQFKLVHRAIDSKMLGGQPFCCKIKNLTNNQLKVEFNLVANTTCGNNFLGGFTSLILEPNESINQCDGFNSALNGNIVTNNDCEGEAGQYTSQGKIYKGTNRIKSIEIGGLTVTVIYKDTRKSGGVAVKANTKPKKELTDDEKLNQAMMQQLEKDFEAEQKPTKKEPIITSNNSNQTSTSSISSFKNEKLNSTEDYKQFVVNKLSKYSYNAKTTSMFGITTNETFKIENLYWQGNTLHIVRYHTMGVGAKQKEDIKWSFSKNEYIGIEPHEKSTTISGRKLWNLIGSYGSIMMFSEDKELIESLCKAFNYIKTNGN